MKVGFIGCGNMAKAILKGIISSGVVKSEEIIASALTISKLEKVKEELGINITTNNLEVAEKSEVLILAIKPYYYDDIIKEVRDHINKNTIVISIAPGKSLEMLLNSFGKEVKIIRTMPNTPSMVLEGMTAVCKNQFVTMEEMEYICTLLNSFGKSAVVEERLMDAVVAVSGSSPAYVYMFIEALADGACRGGLPRELAYKFAAQAVLGSAKMVLETGIHPGALKDMVCSPGGTTIEAVASLEENGFRSAVIEAMKVCENKAKGI